MGEMLSCRANRGGTHELENSGQCDDCGSCCRNPAGGSGVETILQQGSRVFLQRSRRDEGGEDDVQKRHGRPAQCHRVRGQRRQCGLPRDAVDFSGRGSDEAAIIKEASTTFTSGGKVLSDADARVDSSYGRKISVDLANNGGRTMSGIFFSKDHLIQLQVTVLPANGDYASPDLGRFVDSLAFVEARIDPGAIEMKLLK
jgi:hypothetical protein